MIMSEICDLSSRLNYSLWLQNWNNILLRVSSIFVYFFCPADHAGVGVENRMSDVDTENDIAADAAENSESF